MPVGLTPPGSGLPGEGCCDPLTVSRFVDPETSSDPNEQNGSECCPYATVAQAIAALALVAVGETVPRQVVIAAGIVKESITWPNLDFFSIKGAGQGQTIWAPPNGGTGITWSPAALAGAGISQARLEGMTFLLNEAGQLAWNVVSQTFDPDTFLEDGFILRDVGVSPQDDHGVCARFEGIGNFEIDDSCNIGTSLPSGDATGAVLEVVNVGRYRLAGGSQIELLDDDFDGAGNVPGTGRGNHTQDDCIIWEGVRLRNQPRFLQTELATVFAIGESNFSVEGIGLTNLAGFAIVCGLRGRNIGDVLIPLPDLTGNAALIATTEGSFNGSVEISVAAGAVRAAVSGRSAFYRGTVLAGNGVDLDIFWSDYVQQNLTVAGSGTIDRQNHLMLDRDTGNVLNTIPIAPPFPAAFPGGYIANVQQTQDAAFLAVAMTPNAAKLATSVDVQYNVGSVNRHADILITRQVP